MVYNLKNLVSLLSGGDRCFREVATFGGVATLGEGANALTKG